MIRWSYVAPRLLILAVICLFFTLALPPLLRWSLIQSGQAMVGAKVDIGKLKTSLREGRLALHDLQIADPRSPERNLLEASQMILQLDSAALLRKQLVVREGSIRGLKFSGQRSSSGALPDRPTDTQSTIDYQAKALEWLEQLGGLLNDNVVADLESVKVARELGDRWPKEYDSVIAEGEQLKERVQAIRAAVKQAKERPWENIPAVQQALGQATSLRQEMQHLQTRLAQLQQQAMRDKEQLEFARRRDIGRIEEALRITDIRPEALSDYLLGPTLAPYCNSVMQWAAWGKQCLDVAGDPPRPARAQGRTIEFPRFGATPDLLIEKLIVAGEARIDQRPVPFQGTLRSLNSSPETYAKPMLLDLRLDGTDPARLQVAVAHKEGVSEQKIVFHCGAVELLKQQLGKPDTLALQVRQRPADVWVQLVVREQQLKGRVTWKQEQIALRPTVSERYGGQRVAQRLQTALQHVDHLDVQMQLSGTTTKPRVKMQTALGKQLADGLNVAAREELAHQRDALVTKANLEIAEELTQLESKVADKKQKVLSYVSLGEQLINELQQSAAGVRGLIPTGLTPELSNPLTRAIGGSAARPALPDLKQLETMLR